MKKLLMIFFTFNTLIIHSQTELNIIDKNGLKQGKWESYIIDTLFMLEMVFINFDDTSFLGSDGDIDTVCKKTIIESGEYLNSKRNGEWSFYCNNGGYNRTDYYRQYLILFILDSIKKIVSFYPNGQEKAIIYYDNTEPVGDITIFNIDGSPIIEGNTLKNQTFFQGKESKLISGRIYKKEKRFNKFLVEKEYINILEILDRLNK